MTQTIDPGRTTLRDLGNGLVLRQTTRDDADELAAFNSDIHRDQGAPEPEFSVGEWTKDLISGDHPTFDTGDFLVVEDTRAGKIVSTVNHISQTWEYEGIPFKVGRPELVGTLPDYRNRGLVRAQFEVLHRWSIERGEPVQAITGIQWYYKLYGYAYALELGAGRAGYAPHVPKLKDGESEPFVVRTAGPDDVPFIKRLYDAALKRYLVGCVRDEDMWRYELAGQTETSAVASKLGIIETAEGSPVGFIRHNTRLWGPGLSTSALEVEAGASWVAVMPSVLRYLWATGTAYAARQGKDPMGQFSLRLGTEHPAYKFTESRLPRKFPPYAWYIRVPDVPGFLKQIAPALEKRLEGSDVQGYTGELKVSDYRSPFKLVFEKGKLSSVESYKPTFNEDGHAFFPDLTFLEVLFGFHSAAQLQQLHPDCWFANDETRELVAVLFPTKASNVLPIA